MPRGQNEDRLAIDDTSIDDTSGNLVTMTRSPNYWTLTIRGSDLRDEYFLTVAPVVRPRVIFFIA